MLEEALAPPAPPRGLQGLWLASQPETSYVCTLSSPSMLLAKNRGVVAGRVLLRQHALVWQNAATPQKGGQLGKCTRTLHHNLITRMVLSDCLRFQ